MSPDKAYISGVVEGFYGRPWTTDQRKHLFSLLRKFGMNTYLYAPKDDLKHRAEWRILYTSEEAALLESLIRTANDNEITFVYALSPGIDILYSSVKEMKAIKDKLNQVRSLGCNAFSLLFDDIETRMNEADRRKFTSFAHAQLTVANEIYEHMGCPLFFFCPTEYCESSASPTLDESGYLTVLGAELHPDIRILWTGPRVVSRLLTAEHLQRVSAVLKRKPTIWDNLHANDYDPKRVFMGPFLGRSVAIRAETAGLLLNPNCKYEANYIPLFTLSDWIQSDSDAPHVEKDQDAVLETAPTVEDAVVRVVEESTQRTKKRLYHPLNSLRAAIHSWLPHFGSGPGPAIPPFSQRESIQAIAPVIAPNKVHSSEEVPPPTIRTCEGNEMLNGDFPPPIYTSPIGQATTVTIQAFPLSEAIMGVVAAHEDPKIISKEALTVNSLTMDYNEPMDAIGEATSIEASVEPGKEEDSITARMDLDTLETEEKKKQTKKALGEIDLDSIALFVDIFYLPFENGRRAQNILSEFKWLYENAMILRTDSGQQNTRQQAESEEWHRRNADFQSTVEQINDLYRCIIKSPNKSLLQEIFPYLWEAQGLFSILCALLEWMLNGNLILSPSESINSTGSVEVDFDLEPWALSGGLLPDLQKLIAASPKLGELFTIKFPIPLSLTCYRIRPLDFLNVKKSKLYAIFAHPDERLLAETIVSTIPDLSAETYFFDRTFALFLKYGIPAHNFIAESAQENDSIYGNLLEDKEGCTDDCHDSGYSIQEDGMCSLTMAILNVQTILDDMNNVFINEFKRKYSFSNKNKFKNEMKNELTTNGQEDMEQGGKDDDGQTTKSSSSEMEGTDFIDDIHLSYLQTLLHLPKDFLLTYQSLIEIRWPDDATEAVSVRRLLHCISASLALNGSTGFFTIIKSDRDEQIELLSRLGLDILDVGDNQPNNNNGYIILGHSL
ncbi:unnamed protein product [Meloidogyne enterolobii]|uniref:Uncharacterized protein n=1 Tax=Meloidogyne enterolobii TaxID=390850 RepID=A0ACB0Z5K2_MELEN